MSRAGQRRARITIQRYTSGRDAVGGFLETWAEHKKAWARVIDLSGSEAEQGGKVDATATHRFNIRHNDVTPKDRIIWKGRIFNIVKVMDVHEKQRELNIETVEDV